MCLLGAGWLTKLVAEVRPLAVISAFEGDFTCTQALGLPIDTCPRAYWPTAPHHLTVLRLCLKSCMTTRKLLAKAVSCTYAYAVGSMTHRLKHMSGPYALVPLLFLNLACVGAGLVAVSRKQIQLTQWYLQGVIGVWCIDNSPSTHSAFSAFQVKAAFPSIKFSKT